MAAPQPYGAGWMQTGALGSGGEPSVLGRVAGGVAAIGFFISNILAMLVATATALCVLGLGDILFNIENSFNRWTYWRIYFPTSMLVFAAPLILWLNYQLRKGPSVAGRAMGFFNQGVTNILYFVISAILLVIAVFVAFCLVWYGVTDIDACASRPLCSGTNMKSMPNPGAIMLMVGWGLGVLVICAELVLQLYLWYASRQVVTMSVLNDPYAHLADEIEAAPANDSTALPQTRYEARAIVHTGTESGSMADGVAL